MQASECEFADKRLNIHGGFSLFNLSERVLAECQQQVGDLSTGAFVFQGHLFHTSMPLTDAAALYLAYRARIGCFAHIQARSGDTDKPSLTVFPLPQLILSAGPVFPVIVLYGDVWL
ncbi:MAG: hypothetical protein LBJ82_02470, partial [Deltaproteobacteria bacterium]|nr:hypothetical protein [Deltaproteobacteria bacterium]